MPGDSLMPTLKDTGIKLSRGFKLFRGELIGNESRICLILYN
jgi:hypothetical protein